MPSAVHGARRMQLRRRSGGVPTAHRRGKGREARLARVVSRACRRDGRGTSQPGRDKPEAAVRAPSRQASPSSRRQRSGAACAFSHPRPGALRHESRFSLERFAFQSLRPGVSRKKTRFFRLVSAGRRCAAVSHVAFFKGNMFYWSSCAPPTPASWERASFSCAAGCPCSADFWYQKSACSLSCGTPAPYI